MIDSVLQPRSIDIDQTEKNTMKILRWLTWAYLTPGRDFFDFRNFWFLLSYLCWIDSLKVSRRDGNAIVFGLTVKRSSKIQKQIIASACGSRCGACVWTVNESKWERVVLMVAQRVWLFVRLFVCLFAHKNNNLIFSHTRGIVVFTEYGGVMKIILFNRNTFIINVSRVPFLWAIEQTQWLVRWKRCAATMRIRGRGAIHSCEINDSTVYFIIRFFLQPCELITATRYSHHRVTL